MAARRFASCSLFFLAACLAHTSFAHADAQRVERFALVVGSNRGLLTDQPLRYAEADAASMGAVLSYLGGFPRGTLTELYSPSGEQLMAGVRKIAVQVRNARAAGSNVLVVFYYSGHSDGDSLRTSGDLVPFGQVRRAIKTSGAPVRLIIVDACRAGALTRLKGATVRPPIEVQALGDLAAEGEAFIASTTSDELARESPMLRGSFFTHHFVSGLRGAADRSGDGKITLAEAYEYAYSRTVLEAVGEQHPTYSFDLAGRGEVILTSLQSATAALQFDAGPERAFIITDEHGQVVAEIKITLQAGARVALQPGHYDLRYGDASDPKVLSLDLAAGAVFVVPLIDLAPRTAPVFDHKGAVAAEETYLDLEKTLPSVARASERVRPRRRVQLILGHGVGTAPTWVGGGTTTEVAYQLENTGGGATFQRASVDRSGGIALALARVHLRYDIGVRLWERVDLIASLRAQVYVGGDAHTRGTDDGTPPVGGTSAAEGAMAGLFRVRYRFLRGPIVPFAELAIGGGTIRPVLDLSSAQTVDRPLVDQATANAFNADPVAPINKQLVCPTRGACTDSILLGYALVGLGLGMEFELAHRGKTGFAVTLSTTVLGAFGGAQKGVAADFDLGVLFRFL